MIDDLFKGLAAFDEVEAVALGGSRAGTVFDDKSDYDVYVYCSPVVPVEKRKALLARFCSYMELGNGFWEYEDNCVLNDGVDIDIIYRNTDDFAEGISDVVDKHNAHNGYTTCMWHNLRTCKIVVDNNGRLTALKAKYDCPYPKELKANIIDRNMRLLRHSMPAYEHQIAKVAGRNDSVGINHRVTEFLASYFDIIFALNELTHPGEKRLVTLCERNCKKLPKDFRANLDALFSDMFVHSDKLPSDIDRIVSELENILLK